MTIRKAHSRCVKVARFIAHPAAFLAFFHICCFPCSVALRRLIPFRSGNVCFLAMGVGVWTRGRVMKTRTQAQEEHDS